MRALVTGGCGFIGSRLVHALLNKEHSVKVLDVQLGFLKGETSPNLELIGIGSDELAGGMADRNLVDQAVKDVDVIYHLAINWDAVSWTRKLPLEDLFDANIRGTLNLLKAAKSHRVKHFLFSSSCAVYGEAKSDTVDEETVCKPERWDGDPGPAYGIMKLTTEKLCLMYHHHYGLLTTVFRIAAVFSDDVAMLLSKRYIDKVLNDEDVEVVEGQGCSSIHVDEVVDAFLLATMNNRAYGHVFNVSNPATYITHRELYQFIIQLTRSKSRIKVIPNKMQIGCMPESIEKIQQILGWKPQKSKEHLKKAIVHSVESLLKRTG
jgi:UDP-glucose 4-epimerase